MASVTEVGKGKFKVIISNGFRLDGKRDRKTYTIKAANKSEAERIAKVIEGEQIGNRLRMRQTKKERMENITFEELAMLYIKSIDKQVEADKKAPKTVERYKEILNSSLIPYFKDNKIKDISQGMIEEYLLDLACDGVRKDKKKGGYSPRTILHYYRLLHSILNYAVKKDYIAENKCSKVEAPKVEKREIITYDENIINNIVDKLSLADIMIQVLILLGIETGCRRGELMGLEWKDFNFDNRFVTVQRTSNYTKEKGIHTIEHLKNKAKKKVVTYSQELNKLLLEYKEHQNVRKNQVGKAWVETDRLFINEVGEIIDPRKATYWFKCFQTHNNIKDKIRLHDLRHLNISLLLLSGLDVVTVAERAGHSSPRVTLDTYSHTLKDIDYRAANIMANAIYKREA